MKGKSFSESKIVLDYTNLNLNFFWPYIIVFILHIFFFFAIYYCFYLKDHVVGLAVPASSSASLRALCGESPDCPMPDLPKTYREFH